MICALISFRIVNVIFFFFGGKNFLKSYEKHNNPCSEIEKFPIVTPPLCMIKDSVRKCILQKLKKYQ